MNGLALHEVNSVRGDFSLGQVDLNLDRPITCIVGPNGAGKSTLIGCCTGAVPHTGRVFWDGREIGRGAVRDWDGVAYVSDTWPRVFDGLTAADYWHLVAAVRLHRGTRGRLGEWMARAYALLDSFGAVEINRPCQYLSFGSRRKVQLIGALMCEPSLLFIDEPQNGLDFVASTTLAAVLRDHARRPGTVTVMASHDLGSVAAMADAVVALRNGQVVRRLDGGPPEEVRAALERVFLADPSG